MQFVTIEQAQAHCKSDSADNAMLEIYFDAAEAAAVRMLNRNVYLDDDALADAIVASQAAMVAANAAYEAAVEAAEAIEIAEDEEVALEIAEAALTKAQTEHEATLYGILIQPNIISAILLIGGEFYRNREQATIPAAAEALLRPLQRLGPL